MDIKIIHKDIIVHLFLIFLVFKIVLLLIKPDLFRKIRDKTKMVEMTLGPVILITGIWAWVDKGYPVGTLWIWIKLVLMLAGIGLTIVAFKKENKVMGVLALILFIGIYLIAIKRVALGLV